MQQTMELVSLMFEWINVYISQLTLVVQALTWAVLTWTLWWVHCYTLAAEKQVAAALEQVEASQRPFLSVEWVELSGGQRLQAVARAAVSNQPIPLGIVPHEGLKIRPGLKNGSFATGRKERGLQGRGDEAN